MPGTVSLPQPPFLYTLDQIAMLVNLKQSYLVSKVIFFDTLTGGRPPKEMMSAQNIAPVGEKPEWRVSEDEFKRWLTAHGFRTKYIRL